MQTLDDLLNGYRRFRSGNYQRDGELYEKLGTGQSPKVLVIGCADSRVDPGDIFNAGPGELFVVRNVANLVPPYGSGDDLDGVSAALEYAVTALKVEHIVIMGHASCGGVGASLAANEGNPYGQFVAPWVKLLDGARDKVLSAGSDNPQLALEHAGISASIENLMTFPFVSDAVSAGELNLHGAWFNIGKGELHWRDADTGVFAPVAA